MPSGTPNEQLGCQASTSTAGALPFRRLLEKLPAGAYTCDASGLITYYNRHAVQIWGREPRLNDSIDRFCGSFRLFAPDGSPIAHDECWMARALRTGQEYDGEEIVIERPDGSRVTALAHASPIRDEAGQLLGAVNVLVDISDRKRSEAVLRESEQRFAKFMQHLPGLAWIKDLAGRYVFVNDAAERVFCRSREELIGRADEELFPPETAAIFRENDQRALASSTGVETIETLEHEDGLHHSIVSKFPIAAADGAPTMIGGIAIDITERLMAETALQESQERLRTLSANAPAAIYIKDLDGRYTLANPLACQALGRPEGVAGLTDHDLLPAEIADRLRQHDCEVAATGLSLEWEESVCREGYDHDFLSVKFPLFDAHGRPAGVGGVSIDISERKRAEDKLRDADRRKDEFLAMLAHELRNPLAPISNSLHLLRLSDDLSPAAVRVREVMEQQVNQLIHLVDDLLEVSRITRGKIELRKETIELAAVIRGAVETSRPVIEAFHHQLALSLPPEPLTLHADAVRLTQVVANLLNNAAKYTDEGGQIWLTARREGTDVVLSVRDTGVGIPAEMLPRIFELFAQVDRTLSRSQGGLGIGLTLAKRLVQMHGGQIDVRSAGPGRGSEFIVRLPLAEVQRPSASTRPASSVKFDLPAHNILIVDDAEAAAYILGKLLQKMGQRVRTVHDASSALTAALAERPDVVISDIAMPEVDGYELARRLRRQPELAGIVLIALTGYGQDSDRQRAIEAGFDHHLVKPVSLEALQRLLASLPAVTPPAPVS